MDIASISAYFQPVDTDRVNFDFSSKQKLFGNVIDVYLESDEFPDPSDADIAILGVSEDRGSVNNRGCAEAPDFVRSKLYQLQPVVSKSKIVDLGNIRQGHNLSDTHFAVTSVLTQLLKNGTIPLIIGGSQDITFSQYAAYLELDQSVNIVAVDSRFDLGDAAQHLNSENYLGKIIMHQPNLLFNFSNIGYQTYFVGEESVQMMDKLLFDTYRVGQVRSAMEDAEPIVRNADIISFDISAVRQSDAPANRNASPNGFYGDEACQIARYAGLSDKLSCVGFYEINPSLDRDGQTSHLLAQMVWYFIDGFYNRKKDIPLKSKTGFIKYRVQVKNTDHEILFYKSKKSDRWWMEVPYPDNKIKFYRHHIVPCSYKDYQMACNEDIPERWWQAFKKFS